MKKFDILFQALEYIEENLTTVTPGECADKCCYSLSNMQKMFSCTFNIGISDYIARRRLNNAAKDLLGTEMSVLDIALKYGYNSHEVFTRAFCRLFGITPARFRNERTFCDIYPKLSEPRTVVDERRNIIMSDKKVFDVSHLYELFKERRGKIVICFDMVHLDPINKNLGRAVGDAAIAECLHRLDLCTDETMLPARIGGDEFIIITDFTDTEKAQETAEKVLSMNGGTVTVGDKTADVSMRAGFAVIPEKDNIRYGELFDSFIIAGRADS